MRKKKLEFVKLDGWWGVYNGEIELGDIIYDDDWKCLIFEPKEDTIFCKDCLKQIYKFMEEIK
jgi:hypothetical protein